MGGRGSYSAGNYGEIDVSDGKEIAVSLRGGAIGAEETREGIDRMAEMAGLRDIDGTGDIPKGILNAQLQQLQNLEHKYGAIRDDYVEMLAAPGDGSPTMALVAYNPASGRQTLVLNESHFMSVGGLRRSIEREVKDKNFMPTDGSLTSSARYVITHEYAHILHNHLYNQAKQNGYAGTRKQFVSREWMKIQKIANETYNAKKADLSRYGGENRREAFAEAFANAHSGKPNAVGKAMLDYLKSLGY